MTDAQKFEIDFEAIQTAYDAFASGNWAFCFATLSGMLKDARRCGEAAWVEWSEHYMQRRARWYRDELYRETIGRWKAGEFRSRAHMDEVLEQRANMMMAHLGTALTYIWASSSRDACVDALDGVPHGKGGIEWNIVAAKALMEDVREDLFDDHILGDTEPLQVKNGWCESCERWRPEREEYPLGEYACAECSAE